MTSRITAMLCATAAAATAAAAFIMPAPAGAEDAQVGQAQGKLV